MITRMTAGAIVQPISRVVLPWICSGSSWPGLARKRQSTQSSPPWVPMKTTTASQKMRTYRSWIFRAASVLGMTVVCGTLAAQPESSASSATPRLRGISVRA